MDCAFSKTKKLFVYVSAFASRFRQYNTIQVANNTGSHLSILAGCAED